MGTLKKQITDPADVANPNVVKVVTNLLRMTQFIFLVAPSRTSAKARQVHILITNISACMCIAASFCCPIPI